MNMIWLNYPIPCTAYWKPKISFSLYFNRERKKFYSRLFPPKTLYQYVDLLITNPNMYSFPATFLHFKRKSSWKSCCKAALSQSLVTNLEKTPSSIDLGHNITLTNWPMRSKALPTRDLPQFRVMFKARYSLAFGACHRIYHRFFTL